MRKPLVVQVTVASVWVYGVSRWEVKGTAPVSTSRLGAGVGDSTDAYFWKMGRRGTGQGRRRTRKRQQGGFLPHPGLFNSRAFRNVRRITNALKGAYESNEERQRRQQQERANEHARLTRTLQTNRFSFGRR